MPEPAPEQHIDAAANLEAAADQAIEACGGDLRATVIALIVAHNMLEKELSEVYAKASHGFIRGRRVKPKAN